MIRRLLVSWLVNLVLLTALVGGVLLLLAGAG